MSTRGAKIIGLVVAAILLVIPGLVYAQDSWPFWAGLLFFVVISLLAKVVSRRGS